MRKLLALLVAVMLLSNCSKAAVAPIPTSDGDPYAVVGATFQPGLYPDSARVSRYVHYSGIRSDTDSLKDRYSILSSICDDIYTGSGFVTDNVIAVEWYITVGNDTLAHYTAAPLDPLSSPLPGWGDDPAHVVRWSLKIDGLTPKAPLPAAFTATTMPGFQFLHISQADYCVP